MKKIIICIVLLVSYVRISEASVVYNPSNGTYTIDYSGCVPGINEEKIYIDEEEFKSEEDSFHIHIGNNIWIETHTVHRDSTGFFTYECNLSRPSNGLTIGYEKKWKCPYCHSYWPLGSGCQNQTCPSRWK